MSPRATGKDRNAVLISVKESRELGNLLTMITELGLYESKSAFLRSAILRELKTLLMILDTYQEAQVEVSKNVSSEPESEDLLEIKIAMSKLPQKLEKMEDHAKLNELLLRTIRVVKNRREGIEKLKEEINLVVEGLEK